MPLGTVKTLVRRGLIKVRQALGVVPAACRAKEPEIMSNNDIERAPAAGTRGRERGRRPRAARNGWSCGGRSGAAALDQDDSLEQAAAAIELARQPKLEPMPRHVAAAVADAADRFFAPRRTPRAAARAAGAPGLVRLWRLDRRRGELRRGGGAGAAGSPGTVGTAARWRQPLAAGRASRRPMTTGAVAADATGGATAGAAGSGAGVGRACLRASGRRVRYRRVTPVARAPATTRARTSAQPRQALAAQRFVLQRNWAPAGDPVGREVTWRRGLGRPHPDRLHALRGPATQRPVERAIPVLDLRRAAATSAIRSMAACSTCASTATR